MVRSGSILLEPNVLDISSKLVQLWLQEITFLIRPLHLTMSLEQINDVLHSNYPYLLIFVVIATECLSNEILVANVIV